jgi:hypothetical protein
LVRSDFRRDKQFRDIEIFAVENSTTPFSSADRVATPLESA